MTKIAHQAVVAAELVARHAHSVQVDKRGEPYVHHLAAVADQVERMRKRYLADLSLLTEEES